MLNRLHIPGKTVLKDSRSQERFRFAAVSQQCVEHDNKHESHTVVNVDRRHHIMIGKPLLIH